MERWSRCQRALRAYRDRQSSTRHRRKQDFTTEFAEAVRSRRKKMWRFARCLVEQPREARKSLSPRPSRLRELRGESLVLAVLGQSVDGDHSDTGSAQKTGMRAKLYPIHVGGISVSECFHARDAPASLKCVKYPAYEPEGPAGLTPGYHAIQAGTGNPFSRRNGGLNSFDAYRAPPSHKIVTTVCPGPSDFATRMAEAILMPEDVPTDRPSWISTS